LEVANVTPKGGLFDVQSPFDPFHQYLEFKFYVKIKKIDE
jgi:hypothetical protein